MEGNEKNNSRAKAYGVEVGKLFIKKKKKNNYERLCKEKLANMYIKCYNLILKKLKLKRI